MATPSITLANFRAIFNRKIGDDIISVATTSAGASEGNIYNTAISTALIEHKTPSGRNNALVGRYLFVPSANEERLITQFDPETGSLLVDYPFTAQVATATPIEIHRHSIVDKMNLINDGLDWVSMMGHFFNPAYDETLWGQENYGEYADDAEFPKRLYSIPTAFKEFPKIWLVEAYTGRHTGDDAAAVLTDATKNWETNELVGKTLYKKTATAASAAVTENTNDDVTADISGTDSWDEDDEYIVQMPQATPFPLFDLRGHGFEQTQVSALGAFEFYARIPENYLIKLEGKGPLSLFTNEASTTELYTEQAKIVALKCAEKWYEWLLDRAGTQSAEALSNKASRMRGQYLEAIGESKMPDPSGSIIKVRSVRWR